MPKLENWSVVQTELDPYQSPEMQKKYLHGTVFGHDKFPDGDIITTSSIVQAIDKKIYTRSGSVYSLGVVDPEYEKLYPRAKQRLFNNSQEI